MDPVAFFASLLDGTAVDRGLFVGLVAFLILAFFRRWIVPGPTHREIVALKQQRGDEFKESSEKKDVIIADQAKALQIVEHFFSEVPVIERTRPKVGE